MFPRNQGLQQQIVNHGITCIHPGILYFQEKLGNDAAHLMAAYKAARLFSPVKVKEMQPTAADINAFPFLSGELHHLKEELPVYLAKVTYVAHSTEILEWWKDNSNELPYWSSAAQNAFSRAQPYAMQYARLVCRLSDVQGKCMHDMPPRNPCALSVNDTQMMKHRR